MIARSNKSKGAATGTMAYETLSHGTETLEGDLGVDAVVEGPVPVEEGTQRMKGVLGLIEQVARISASLGVAGAAIFGVIEYISSNEDIRRERSLGFVESWQDGGHIDRYTRIQTYVETQLKTSTLPLQSLPAEIQARAYQNLGYNWVVDLRSTDEPEAKTIEADIDRLTLFFAQMDICISAELCNADVLRAYFSSEVTTFWQYFQGYAQLRQEANYQGYGSQVTALVARFQVGNTE